jgi:hypothetical protein
LDTLFYYGYNPFLTQVYGTIVGGSLLVGYEWVTNRATVAIYAGGEVMNTSLSPNDPNNSVKGGRGGFKIATDFYVTPTDDMMISGVASYSTNFNSYYGRLKFGFAIADRIYIGPEAGALYATLLHGGLGVWILRNVGAKGFRFLMSGADHAFQASFERQTPHSPPASSGDELARV